MFVEEGFRIRFANGEVIDFYADSAAEKDGWMRVLNDVVGKDAKGGSARAWTEMVLKRERSLAAKASARAPGFPRKTSAEKEREREKNVNAMKSAPTSPVKKGPRQQHQRSEQLGMVAPRPRGQGLMGGMSRAERDKKVRSMFM